MKRVLILFMTILCSTVYLYAEKASAIIITNSDTLNVEIHIPIDINTGHINFKKMQCGIKYYDSESKKIKLKPDQVNEFSFTYNEKEYRFFSIGCAYELGGCFSSNTHLLLEIIEKNKLSVYNYYYDDKSYDWENRFINHLFFGRSPRVVLDKEYGGTKDSRYLKDRLSLLAYFADCKELFNKIKSKEFKKKDLEKIISFYNSNCGK